MDNIIRTGEYVALMHLELRESMQYHYEWDLFLLYSIY